jgi:hypothetical protein
MLRLKRSRGNSATRSKFSRILGVSQRIVSRRADFGFRFNKRLFFYDLLKIPAIMT